MRPAEAALAAAAVGLGRALRAAGLPAGVDAELTLCRALGELDLRRREHVYWAARSCFVRDRRDVAAFERLFERFWAGEPLEEQPRVAEHGEGDPRMPAPAHGGESVPPYRPAARIAETLGGAPARAQAELPSALGDEASAADRRGVLAAYSPDEVLAEREPLLYAPGEVEALRRLADELRRVQPLRRSRRAGPGRRGGRLDVRRTVRRSLETGGEPLRLVYAERALRPRRLLFLCDVSGSMERYSRAALGSLQAAVGASPKTEAFVFATRLTRVTPILGRRDAGAALERAREAVLDWSGGTRIGGALAEFRRTYGRLGLARGAVVVVLSDGWDRGDPDLLARELQALRLQARRLVWLNPRPAELGGQPLALGMQVALRYVDDHVPGCDPRALAALARVLGGLGAGRPKRAQRVGWKA